jgi:hypothetical protein
MSDATADERAAVRSGGRGVGGLLAGGLGRMARDPGTVTLFVVLGTIPLLVEPGGTLATAFGYLHQLVVLYAATVALLTAGDPRSFPERLGTALVRFPAVVPFGLVLLAANAAVGFGASRVVPTVFESIVPAVLVPLVLSPLALAPAAAALEGVGSLRATRSSLRLTGAHRRRTLALVVVYVLATGLAVGVETVGVLVGGQLAVAAGDAVAAFAGTLVIAPLAAAFGLLYRELEE